MARKNDAEEREDMLDSEQGGSRVYELGFHLDPELPSEEVKKAYQTVRESIEKRGGLVAEGEPEQIQLAYTISRQETTGRRDFNSAFFAWIAYETSAENHAEILEEVRADKRIVRFIDLVTTKEAARHSAELSTMRREAPRKEADADAESVSDAELDAALQNAAA